MVIPIAALSAWSAFMGVQGSDVYVFRKSSASYVVERVASAPPAGLVPSSVRLQVDEGRNQVRLEGPKSDIETVKRTFSMFDVAPLRVEMQLDGELPLMGYVFSNPIVVANNAKWILKEPQVGLDLTALARINDDGSVTVFVELHSGGTLKKLSARFKPREEIQFDQRGIAGKPEDEPHGEPDPGPPFRLRLVLKQIITPGP